MNKVTLWELKIFKYDLIYEVIATIVYLFVIKIKLKHTEIRTRKITEKKF